MITTQELKDAAIVIHHLFTFVANYRYLKIRRMGYTQSAHNPINRVTESAARLHAIRYWAT